jgi:predicted nuclease with TOPRIM domain
MNTDDKTVELIFEQFRILRNDNAELRRDLREDIDGISRRFNTLDDRLSALDKHISALYGLITNLGGDVDGLKRRLRRIEDRLNIIDEIPAH